MEEKALSILWRTSTVVLSNLVVNFKTLHNSVVENQLEDALYTHEEHMKNQRFPPLKI